MIQRNLILLLLLILLSSCSKEYRARKHFEKALKLDSTILKKLPDSSKVKLQLKIPIVIKTEEKNYLGTAVKELDTTELLIINKPDVKVWASKTNSGKAVVRVKLPAKDTTIMTSIDTTIVVPNKLVVVTPPQNNTTKLAWFKRALLWVVKNTDYKTILILLFSVLFIRFVLNTIKRVV